MKLLDWFSVHRNFVGAQCCGSVERHTTVNKCTLVCIGALLVHRQVPCKLTLMQELFRAVHTSKGFLTIMASHMTGQVPALSKCSTAKRAAEWPCSRMMAHVNFKRMRVQKLHLAAIMWTCAYAPSHVRDARVNTHCVHACER